MKDTFRSGAARDGVSENTPARAESKARPLAACTLIPDLRAAIAERATAVIDRRLADVVARLRNLDEMMEVLGADQRKLRDDMLQCASRQTLDELRAREASINQLAGPRLEAEHELQRLLLQRAQAAHEAALLLPIAMRFLDRGSTAAEVVARALESLDGGLR
jgi:hypothetical protein